MLEDAVCMNIKMLCASEDGRLNWHHRKIMNLYTMFRQDAMDNKFFYLF